MARGKTVREQQAIAMSELLERGVDREEAEAVVGVTLATLRQSGVMTKTVKAMMERAANADLINHKHQNRVARAVLVEHMLQDEDPKLAVRAAGKLIDADRVSTAVQILNQQNNTFSLPTDPQTLKSLESLKLLMPGEGEIIDVTDDE